MTETRHKKGGRTLGQRNRATIAKERHEAIIAALHAAIADEETSPPVKVMAALMLKALA